MRTWARASAWPSALTKARRLVEASALTSAWQTEPGMVRPWARVLARQSARPLAQTTELVTVRGSALTMARRLVEASALTSAWQTEPEMARRLALASVPTSSQAALA
jgi:hypothetical protein